MLLFLGRLQQMIFHFVRHGALFPVAVEILGAQPSQLPAQLARAHGFQLIVKLPITDDPFGQQQQFGRVRQPQGEGEPVPENLFVG